MMAQAFGEVLATSPATFETICFSIPNDPTNMRDLFQRIIERNLSSPPSRPFPHCKAPGCQEPHEKHRCNSCFDTDSTHRTKDCPKSRPVPHCKAPGCLEAHEKHHCNCCGKSDSTHRSKDCPSKKGWACSLLGGNVDNNFTKYLKYKNKYLALKK